MMTINVSAQDPWLHHSSGCGLQDSNSHSPKEEAAAYSCQPSSQKERAASQSGATLQKHSPTGGDAEAPAKEMNRRRKSFLEDAEEFNSSFRITRAASCDIRVGLSEPKANPPPRLFQASWRQFEMFSNMSTYSVCACLEAMKLRMFNPGDVIIAKGTIGTSMFFIDTGRAQAVHDSTVVEELSSGDFFGEMTFIATCKRIVKDPSAKFHNIQELQRTCDIQAIEQCRCFELSVSDLMSIGGDEVMRLMDSLQPVAEFRKAKLSSKGQRKSQGSEESDDRRGASQGKLPTLKRSSSSRQIHSHYLSQPRGRPSPEAFNSWHGNKNRDLQVGSVACTREDMSMSFGKKLETGLDGGIQEPDGSHPEFSRCPSRSSRSSSRCARSKSLVKHEHNNVHNVHSTRSPSGNMTIGDFMDKRGKSMGGHQGHLELEVEGMDKPVPVMCVVEKKLLRIFTDPPAFSTQLSVLNLHGMCVCVAGDNPLAIQLKNGSCPEEEQGETVRLLTTSILHRDFWLNLFIENGAEHQRLRKRPAVRKEFYLLGLVFLIATFVLIDLVI